MADLTVTPGVGSLTISGAVPALTATFTLGDYLPTILSIPQLQAQINDILAKIYGAAAGFGSALPAVDGSAEGRIFVVTPGLTTYQMQNGVWTAI